MEEGQDWMGVCSYTEEKKYYPFNMKIGKVDGAKVEAVMSWKTLGDAKTRVKGTIVGDEFKFQEYEVRDYHHRKWIFCVTERLAQVIQGKDEVEVPMDYKGKLKGNSIVGDVGDKSQKVTFKLDPTFKIKPAAKGLSSSIESTRR